MKMKEIRFVPFSDVEFEDGFWKRRYELNRDVSMNAVRARFEETGRFDALRFNYLKNGRKPHYFFDSDAAKWMEAVAYLYQKDPDSMKDHIALCEELIDTMAAAQREDGYLNSYHQQIEPELIFKDRGHHELYCAGHLIEAAVAYAEATGREKFLHIMEKYCDLIERAFITEKFAAFTTPGHEEIELALFKLYHYTKNEKYLDMAKFFLDQRGNTNETDAIGMLFPLQDDAPVRAMTGAHGHSVRALYLASAVADYAVETGDADLIASVHTVFDDITERKSYITGGIGSTRTYEGFTIPYDLPNPTAYNESCAAIANVFFATRMRRLGRDARVGDFAERNLYNASLSSTSLDGKAFFYENPTEIDLEARGREEALPPQRRERLPITQRVEVFDCSCCPPNINRFYASVGGFAFVEEDGQITIEQYFTSRAKTSFGTIRLGGEYAKDGVVTISSEDYSAGEITLRIPAWSGEQVATLDGKKISLAIRDGYATVKVGKQFSLTVDFRIEPFFVEADPRVTEDCGRMALVRGPLVYCLESVDNGSLLRQIEIDPAAVDEAILSEGFHGFYDISLPAARVSAAPDGRLYYPARARKTTPVTAKFIPYFAFANRGESDLLVFVRRK